MVRASGSGWTTTYESFYCVKMPSQGVRRDKVPCARARALVRALRSLRFMKVLDCCCWGRSKAFRPPRAELLVSPPPFEWAAAGPRGRGVDEAGGRIYYCNTPLIAGGGGLLISLVQGRRHIDNFRFPPTQPGFFVNDSFFLLTRGIHQVSSPPKAGALYFCASAESSATHPARQRRP